jgi:uncharacterized FAD-dependent dehydrogenase
MIKEIDFAIAPDFIENYNYQKNIIANKLHINSEEIKTFKVLRRSIDARKSPVYRLRVAVFINELPKEELKFSFKDVSHGKTAYIIGSGPAGLFCALKLIESGIRPVIYERGNDVRKRRRDLRAIQQFGIVNPDSNYCFGEGGAGTYSDGKLYTRATKRGDVSRILSLFVYFGAEKEIEFDAHPHIGSDKLPKIVSAMRDLIIKCGGEVHFNSRLTDINFYDGKLKSFIINEREEIPADVLILATGHSARDIYYLLNKKNIALQKKDFAIGVRIEHPQQLIDEIQYNSKIRNPNLPASSYSLSCQIDEKGVYSFCMCPGGIIVPASTNVNELVLNGMSVSRRNSLFANSGLVTQVNENDWKDFNEHGLFAGLEFQKSIEEKAFILGGKKQQAPAQRVTDFIEDKVSSALEKTSYIPGIVSVAVSEILPAAIVARLKQGIIEFDKKMRGYLTSSAQILAAETRTSSPIRIPRDPETFMHIETEGLFPSGEGAGYAGGIVSAAIDGENTAMHVTKYLTQISQ